MSTDKKHKKRMEVLETLPPEDSKVKRANLIEKIRDLAHPTEHMLEYDSVVIKSTLYDDDPHVQTKNIVDAFNGKGARNVVTKSIFGTRIEPENFRMVALNKVAQLVAPDGKQYRKVIFPNPVDKCEDLGQPNKTQLFFGAYGSYVVNVPVGKIAKIWRGNVPVLLGPGPHVIHDPNLKEVKDEDLVDINSNYITHSTIRIIRVQPNTVVKVLLKSNPYILTPSKEPYVFNEPIFEVEATPLLLKSEYIQHKNFHILQIPHGKIAKVWFGQRSEILEASEEPLLFNDPIFKVEQHNDSEVFFSATAKIIIHGSIKRIIPSTGEVAVTFNSGKLVVYGPPEDKKPIIINNQNHEFYGFLSTNIQTIQFPSKNTIKQRLGGNKNAGKQREDGKQHEGDGGHEYADYEIFRTSDGLPIGVKLLVVYKISDPELTLTEISYTNILPHIENIVVADMGRAIQSCTSVDFLSSNQMEIRPSKQLHQDVDLLTDSHQTSKFYTDLQNAVKNQLISDFKKYGIDLVRLNIETPKVLDKTISTKMAEFSLMNTEARAKEAVLDRNFKIAKTLAEQEAEKMRIKQQQENQNKVSVATAELDAAKMKADAKLIEYEAEAKGQQLLLDVSRRRAELYKEFPQLLQYDSVQLQSAAMKSISTTIISPEVAEKYYGVFGISGVASAATAARPTK